MLNFVFPDHPPIDLGLSFPLSSLTINQLSHLSFTFLSSSVLAVFVLSLTLDQTLGSNSILSYSECLTLPSCFPVLLHGRHGETLCCMHVQALPVHVCVSKQLPTHMLMSNTSPCLRARVQKCRFTPTNFCTLVLEQVCKSQAPSVCVEQR